MDDVLTILETFSDYLGISNIFVYGWRKMAWAFLRGLKLLSDAVDTLVNASFKLVNFGNSQDLKNFVSDNRGAVFAVGTIFLIFFSFSMMQNSRKSNMKTLINNISLGLGVLLLSLTLTTTIMKGSANVSKAIIQGDSTSADQIFKSNIVDVTTFDKFNWESVDKVSSITYNDKSLAMMDITEEVFPAKLKPKPQNDITKKVFDNKVVVNMDGKRELTKLDRGMFQMDENYYRYSWHPWIILVQLLTSILVRSFASFKFTKCLFNGFFNGMIAPFFALSDLVEGSKVWKLIKGIVNCGVTMILFSVSLKMYELMSTYAGGIDSTIIAKVLLQLFLAFIVVEGPYIVQELTGQDGGVRSEGKALVGSAVGAAFLGSKAGKSIKDGLSSASDKVKKGANFMAGMAQGAADFGKESKDTLEADMNNEAKTASPTTKEDLNPASDLDQSEQENFQQEVQEELEQPDDAPEYFTPGEENGLDNPENEFVENGPEESLENDSMDELGSLSQSEPPSLEEESETGSLSKLDDGLSEEVPDGGKLSIDSDSKLSRTSTLEDKKDKLPEAALVKATPLKEAIDTAMDQTKDARTTANLPSQRAIQQALGGSGTDAGTVGSLQTELPEAVASHPGVQAVKQDSVVASMSSPSSARLTQMIQSSRPVGTMPGRPIQAALRNGHETPRPIVQGTVPASVRTMSGVQQYQQDLAQSNQPITNDTLSDIVSNKWADRAIRKAKEREVYQEYRQIGRNTAKQTLDSFEPRKKREDE